MKISEIPFPLLDRSGSEDTDCFAMADKNDKYPENVPGKFYVDEQCIDCDLCRETAPTVFTRNDDGGFSFVFKQPETEEELELAREAIEGCPVEAIGEDGDDEEG